MRKAILISIISLFFIGQFIFPFSSYSQADKVRSYLNMLARGKTDEVKAKLPELQKAYPSDPGVILLKAAVLEDASKAIGLYELILKNYPESEWADDAYLRVVQYYAVSGDTSKATEELDKYRKKYPSSEFLIQASDVVHSSLVVNRRTSKSISSNTKTTPVKDSVKVLVDDKNTRYGLQVGVFSSKESAVAEQQKYTKQRINSQIFPKEVDEEKMFAVVVGNYSTQEAAEKSKELIKTICNCSPILFKFTKTK